MAAVPTAGDINPPQLDAPPIEIKAADSILLTDLLGDIIAPDPTTPDSVAPGANPPPGLRLPRDAAGIPIKNPGPLKQQPGPCKPPPQPQLGQSKAPPQCLIDQDTAAVEAIRAEEMRRATIHQHRAKSQPPMFPQPPSAKFRASERTQAEHEAKADAEAKAYNDQQVANIAKNKKGAEAREAKGQGRDQTRSKRSCRT